MHRTLDGNPLTVLPDSIGNLTALTYLLLIIIIVIITNDIVLATEALIITV